MIIGGYLGFNYVMSYDEINPPLAAAFAEAIGRELTDGDWIAVDQKREKLFLLQNLHPVLPRLTSGGDDVAINTSKMVDLEFTAQKIDNPLINEAADKLKKSIQALELPA